MYCSNDWKHHISVLFNKKYVDSTSSYKSNYSFEHKAIQGGYIVIPNPVVANARQKIPSK